MVQALATVAAIPFVNLNDGISCNSFCTSVLIQSVSQNNLHLQMLVFLSQFHLLYTHMRMQIKSQTISQSHSISRSKVHYRLNAKKVSSGFLLNKKERGLSHSHINLIFIL